MDRTVTIRRRSLLMPPIAALILVVALTGCNRTEISAWVAEVSARFRAMLPWTEPDITGEWSGFVRLTGSARNATVLIRQTGTGIRGEIRPQETVQAEVTGGTGQEPGQKTGDRYPFTGSFTNRSIVATIRIANDVCTGTFQIQGVLERDYLRMTGSGDLCGEKALPLKSDLKRIRFTLPPDAPGEEPPQPDKPPEAPLWVGDTVPEFPVAWDARPYISELTDPATGQVAGFSFEIPATQKFPTPTQCERLGEPENVCQIEGGMVPDERDPWPLGSPSYLDWAVLDLDEIAAGGHNTERIVFPSDGISSDDRGFALHQLITHPGTNALEIPAVTALDGSTAVPPVLAGAALKGRYLREIMGGDFRPRLFARSVAFDRPVVLASGSEPLTNCDFTRRCRGEVSLRKTIQKLDLSNYPNLVLSAHIRTSTDKAWFRRPYLAKTGGMSYELKTSFNPPGLAGKPYDVYSNVSSTPLTRGELRVDYPLVTLQRSDENKTARVGVRISVAQIVNGMFVAAPRYPSVAEASLQMLSGKCVETRKPSAEQAREQCPGLLQKPVRFPLRVPERPDVPSNPSRDGAIGLSSETWTADGKVTWSDTDWLSLDLQVDGAPGFTATEHLLMRAKEAYPDAGKVLRLVATPRLIDFFSVKPESFTYRLEAVLVSGDRMDLTLDPASQVKISHVSIPAADLGVKDGFITVSTPGMAILRFSHPKFPAIPAEIAVWAREKGNGGSATASGTADPTP